MESLCLDLFHCILKNLNAIEVIFTGLTCKALFIVAKSIPIDKSCNSIAEVLRKQHSNVIEELIKITKTPLYLLQNKLCWYSVDLCETAYQGPQSLSLLLSLIKTG